MLFHFKPYGSNSKAASSLWFQSCYLPIGMVVVRRWGEVGKGVTAGIVLGISTACLDGIVFGWLVPTTKVNLKVNEHIQALLKHADFSR